MKVGELFIQRKLATEQQVVQALEVQKRIGGKLGEILLAISGIRALDYYQSLAHHFKIEFIDLLAQKPNTSLLRKTDRSIYLEKLTLPIEHHDQQWTIATADPSEKTFAFIKTQWGVNCKIVGTSRLDILWTLQAAFKEHYVDEALNDLIKNNIAFSAKQTFVIWHKLFLLLLLSGTITGAILRPINTLFIINVFLTFCLFGAVFYKFILATIGFFLPKQLRTEEVKITVRELPIYTLLIPLYKEKEITLCNLIDNLDKLDYPRHLLDIKLLLEEDDQPTIKVLKSFRLPAYYEFIYIPSGTPKTKAKACNYGLKFARGEYLTLYDAEDQPDPNQLKAAFATFQNSEKKLACVQCGLNFYNSRENWLTRMFTLEYTYWFDLMLPALSFTHAPIPLGGTSNHFKTAVLREIDAWDPYNVAEDADVGIRLHRLGYKTKVIPSTTREEANCRLINWLKQRTRWIKGYMQTYLVHMRNPFKLLHAVGIRGFLSFQLFVGGTILTNLANIVLWGGFIAYLALTPTFIQQIFTPTIKHLAFFNLLSGSIVMILLNLAAVIRRRQYFLIVSALTAPIYWLLMSLASLRALYQLFFKPSYWDKTEHGISKQLRRKRRLFVRKKKPS